MAIGFRSQEDVRLIREAVRRNRATPQGVQRQERNVTVPQGANLQAVEITSTTQTSDRYPGKWYEYNASDKTWTEKDDVWVVDVNGTALATGVKYDAWQNGFANSRPVFQVDASNSPVIKKDTLSSDQDDYDIEGADVLQLTLSGNITITGFAGGADGKILRIFARGHLTITHFDSDSLSANQVECTSDASIVMNENMSVWLIYDSTSGYWKQASEAQAGYTIPGSITNDDQVLGNGDKFFPGAIGLNTSTSGVNVDREFPVGTNVSAFVCRDAIPPSFNYAEFIAQNFRAVAHDAIGSNIEVAGYYGVTDAGNLGLPFTPGEDLLVIESYRPQVSGGNRAAGLIFVDTANVAAGQKNGVVVYGYDTGFSSIGKGRYGVWDPDATPSAAIRWGIDEVDSNTGEEFVSGIKVTAGNAPGVTSPLALMMIGYRA